MTAPNNNPPALTLADLIVDGLIPEPSADAMERVRLAFNPSGRTEIDAMKFVMATAMTMCEQVRDRDPARGRSAAIAITELQTASMYAVHAMTTGL